MASNSSRAQRLKLFRKVLAAAKTPEEKARLARLYNAQQAEMSGQGKEIERLKKVLTDETTARTALEHGNPPSHPDTGSTALGDCVNFFTGATLTFDEKLLLTCSKL
jgi:hypothetical protein